MHLCYLSYFFDSTPLVIPVSSRIANRNPDILEDGENMPFLSIERMLRNLFDQEILDLVSGSNTYDLKIKISRMIEVS